MPSLDARLGTFESMQKLLIVLAAALLVFAACGGDGDSAGDHDHGSHSHDGEEDDGHAHEIKIGRPADASDADRTVEITAKDYAFDPSAIAVDRGETIEFVVTNEGTQPHEFTIGDQAFHDAASGGTHDHGGQSTGVIEPGETGSLTWRFTTVANILFACHVDDHFDRNMFGSLRVLL